MVRNIKIGVLLLFSFLFLSSSAIAGASSVGDIETFNIESSFDTLSRNEVPAILHRVTNKLYYYIEESWWNELSDEERMTLDQRMYNASVEFERNIFPQMTSLFGSIPDHPVDKSDRITVLFHRMPLTVGGYFNTGDQFTVFQNHRSNERNMIYINALKIEGEVLESFLAHELMHLITFNEKDKTHRVSEEIWLNEARAEYISTIFGHDGGDRGNIARRISTFLRHPETSLTQWDNLSRDYGVVNLFIHYLVDHYGIEILVDSLKSDKVGIESIDEALEKNGHTERFADIFTDWTIAVLINDCDLGERYCFLNPEFSDLRITPSTKFLPTSYGSSFSVKRSIDEWSAFWQRVVGGKGIITLEFEGDSDLNFRVPYILCGTQDSCEVGFMNLNDDNKGTLSMDDMFSITFIPSLQTSDLNQRAMFSWKITTREENQVNEDKLISTLLAQIEELKKEIARLEALIAESAKTPRVLINRNLSFGSRGPDVSLLQEFLKSKGPEIYPEGLVTGNFFSLTRNAVIRFQERYADEILAPLGLKRGTGFVGEMTIRKINEMLSY